MASAGTDSSTEPAKPFQRLNQPTMAMQATISTISSSVQAKRACARASLGSFTGSVPPAVAIARALRSASL